MHGLFTQCVCIYGADIAARKQAGKELAMNIAESTIEVTPGMTLSLFKVNAVHLLLSC